MKAVDSSLSLTRKSARWLVVTAILATFCVTAEAQQSTKVPRIGFLSRRDAPNPTTPDPLADAFRQGLRELGYVEGKTILIEYRYAAGNTERLPILVAELLQVGVDVLVSATLPGIRAAKQATTTIPIVMVTPADPVETGLIDSLARPGGNITGLTRLTRGLSGKRLEVLKEAVPKIERVGILNGGTNLENDFKDFELAARHLQLELQSLEVRGPNPDFEGAFQAAVKRRVTQSLRLALHNY